MVEIVKIKDVNSHSKRKEKTCLEISLLRLGAASAPLTSPTRYAPKYPTEKDGKLNHVGDDAIEDVEDD